MSTSLQSNGGSKARQKRFESKVRTGCKTCRLRRVKCSEEKPSCQKCITVGRICEGYETMRIATTATTANGVVTLKWMIPSTQPSDTDIQEQEAFHFFRHHVMDGLSGPFDSRMWYHIILPVSMIEASVRHALIALGSLAIMRPRNDAERLHFALSQYGKAMDILQTQITRKQVSRDLALVTCILFVAFEFQQGGWEQAKCHLQGGLTMIDELRVDHNQSLPQKQGDVDPLVEAFERLDVQISLFTSSRVHLRPTAASLSRKMEFENIASASNSLNQLMAVMRQMICTIEEQRFSSSGLLETDYEFHSKEVSALLLLLRYWNQSSDELFSRISDAREQQAGKVLRTHYICSKLMVSNCLSDGHEMGWDSFQDDFATLLDLAEEVWQVSECLSSANQTGRSSFSIDMGIIPPAYFAAIKCRDPKLRRRAIALLRNCNHQEGAWNGSVSARLAEAIVNLEENGLGNVVVSGNMPEENRLYQAWYDLSLTSERVLYCKRRRFESDGRWIEYQERVR